MYNITTKLRFDMLRFSILLFIAVLSLYSLRSPSSASTPTDVSIAKEGATVAAVKKVLTTQVAAWNKGDIPGFMAGYANVEGLRFASGNTVTSGWAATKQRYQKRYTDRKLMGTLTFKDVTVKPLSPEYAEVFGRFHLSRDKDTGDATGLFTLLMHKEAEGWRVLHDHTSSE